MVWGLTKIVSDFLADVRASGSVITGAERKAHFTIVPAWERRVECAGDVIVAKHKEHIVTNDGIALKFSVPFHSEEEATVHAVTLAEKVSGLFKAVKLTPLAVDVLGDEHTQRSNEMHFAIASNGARVVIALTNEINLQTALPLPVDASNLMQPGAA